MDFLVLFAFGCIVDTSPPDPSPARDIVNNPPIFMAGEGSSGERGEASSQYLSPS
jgi:hypothetical protein